MDHIGSTTLAGVTADIESSASAGRSVRSPGTPIFVGQADLTNGSASADEVKRIVRPRTARTEFGDADNSLLTQCVEDAIVSGAFPVYAVAPAETTTTDDLSGESGQTATLQENPIIEDASRITVTVNSTDKDVTLSWGDVANEIPSTDEAIINPQTGQINVDESLGNTGDDIEYDYADFTNTFDAITSAEIDNVKVRNVVDFIGVADEGGSTMSDAITKAENMATNDWYAIAVGGAGDPWLDDSNNYDNYTNPHDSSRGQLIYPSRKDDASESVLGAYLGLRANTGITRLPIHSKIESVSGLQYSLERADREAFILEEVNPLEERGVGIRVGEDLTTVSDDNTEESAWRRGFSRLLTDFVTESLIEVSDPYIGEFNEIETRNSIATSMTAVLDPLLENSQIQGYSLVLEADSSISVAADIGIKAADPIRNINLTVAAGEVRGGTRTVAE